MPKVVWYVVAKRVVWGEASWVSYWDGQGWFVPHLPVGMQIFHVRAEAEAFAERHPGSWVEAF